MSDKFYGYKRPDGSFGVRNYLLILPTVICSAETAMHISNGLEGSTCLLHQEGCAQIGEDAEQTLRTLAGAANNANVAAVLVVGLGCEMVNPKELAHEISKTGKPVEVLVIQNNGGTENTINEGLKIGHKLQQKINSINREEADISNIILGIECGGSDTTSGLAGNPVAGFASDKLIKAGGTTYISELPELIGAEHLLAKRGECPETKNRIINAVKDFEGKLKKCGVDFRGSQPSPGNIEGGLTTIEEKSLGAIYKSGNSTVKGVLRYSDKAKVPGLYIMETPGSDIESMSGMIAGGAQIIIFTTGRGTPVGSPIAPVIKLCANENTVQAMYDNIDFDASPVISGVKTIEEMSEGLFAKIINVASGELVKAEKYGFKEFSINRIGPSL